MKYKNILVRADSSSTIGTGHIMRDLVLARQYRNDNVTFATLNLEGNINQKIIDSGYKFELLKSNDLAEVINFIKKNNIDLIIIDHYGIDYHYEKELKEKTGVKVLSFDDTYEKHFCDILLNHNISAKTKKYKELVTKNCELRCGSKYTLLRDEFLIEKKRKRKLSKNPTLFIAMGGADHSNINIKILKVINKFKNIDVNIVTTNANKNLENLKEYSKNKKWINLHINSNKIAKLMNRSDFAIVTPSVTVNEIHFMKIPFIAIKTASNQKDLYKYLKKKKFLTLKEFDKNKLKKKIIELTKKIKHV